MNANSTRSQSADDSSDSTSCQQENQQSSPSDDGSISTSSSMSTSKFRNGDSPQTSHHNNRGHEKKRPAGDSVTCHSSSFDQKTPRKKKKHHGMNSDDLKDFESPEIFFEKVYQRHMSPKKYSASLTPSSSERRTSAATVTAWMEDSPRRVSFPLDRRTSEISSPELVKPPVTKPLLYDSSDDELDLAASRSASLTALHGVTHASIDVEIDKGQGTVRDFDDHYRNLDKNNKDGNDRSGVLRDLDSEKKTERNDPEEKTSPISNKSGQHKSIRLSWINQPPGPEEPLWFEKYGIKWYWCQLCNKCKGRWRTHSTEQHEEKYSSCKKISATLTDPIATAVKRSAYISSSLSKCKTASLDNMRESAETPISNHTGNDNNHDEGSTMEIRRDVTQSSPLHSVSDSSLEDSHQEITISHSASDAQYLDHGNEDERILLRLIEESIQRDHHPSSKDIENSKITTLEKTSAVGKEMVSSVKPGTASNCVNEKEYKTAVQNLRHIEKVLVNKHHQGMFTHAIKESRKKDVSEYCYHLMRQFMVRYSSQEKHIHQSLSSRRCIICCHCSKDILCVKKSVAKRQIKLFRRHLYQCKRTPVPVKVALQTLEKLDKEHVQKNGNAHKLINTMDRIEQTSKLNNSSVEKCVEDLEEDFISGRDLPEMYVFDRQKQLSADHYPTLTFTAWNDKKDYLYDFKVFVGPSRIPNAGNGAFLKLLRVRVRKPKVEKVIPITRCPLTVEDSNGKPVKVFIGPNRIHDDFGPDNDDHYMEDNSIKFSSWDDGCGSIDIGSYGPFFPSDIKKESHYELKNFLFDFEPQGWSYGFHSSVNVGEGDICSKHNFVLDITNDYSGEPHMRARENIPMHVNETGHNADLEVNVTPLEPEQGIHYYAHPKTPIGVGDTIELLVNYGEIYEEVRERKGYGKSTLGSDQVESQRVKRNQCERVKVEDFIMSEPPEELYDLLLSIRGTVDSILESTDCYKTSARKDMNRQWTARFRIHWIETLFRKRFIALKSQMEPLLFSTAMDLLDKMRYDGSSKAQHTMINDSLIKELALKETMEESVFLCSKDHQLLHPLDPSLWCALALDVVHELGQKLAFELKTGNFTQAQALENIYRLAKDASTEVRRISETRKEVPRLAFKKTENPIVKKFLKTKVKSSGDKVKPKLTYWKVKDADGRSSHHTYLIRCIESEVSDEVAQNGRAQTFVDTQWYVLWQVIRVVHVIVTMCLPSMSTIYSLERLCSCAGVSISDVKRMLQNKMIDPYNEELYVSAYSESGFNEAIVYKSKHNTTSRVRQIRASGDRIKKMEERRLMLLQSCCQTDNFIPDVHKNVVRNRKCETFWKELPAGPDCPKGWILHVHKRKNGVTGGRFLDYYWFTNNGKKLRSQVEVKRFIDALELAMGDEDAALGIFEGKSIVGAPTFASTEVKIAHTAKLENLLPPAATQDVGR